MNLDRRATEAALPGYEIGNEIGRGAFGIVYEGRHRTLGRRVAVKQLPRALGADPGVRARFLTEAKMVASFDHSHIVPVYDYVEHEGLRLLVMEHLGEGTLATLASAGKPPIEVACAVVIAVALGLQHAHERGVLHRDVKPENVLFTESTPKLADFGIAKSGDDSARLTVTGTVIGTVAYMSPEQATGSEMGPPSDIYACAVMLYELLANRLPYPATNSITAQLVQHVTATAAPLAESAPDVPGPIADVVMQSLAKNPSERPSSAAAFAVALDQACVQALGPRWLRHSGINVVGLDRAAAAVRAAGDDTAGHFAVIAETAAAGAGRDASTIGLSGGGPSDVVSAGALSAARASGSDGSELDTSAPRATEGRQTVGPTTRPDSRANTTVTRPAAAPSGARTRKKRLMAVTAAVVALAGIGGAVGLTQRGDTGESARTTVATSGSRGEGDPTGAGATGKTTGDGTARASTSLTNTSAVVDVSLRPPPTAAPTTPAPTVSIAPVVPTGAPTVPGTPVPTAASTAPAAPATTAAATTPPTPAPTVPPTPAPTQAPTAPPTAPPTVPPTAPPTPVPTAAATTPPTPAPTMPPTPAPTQAPTAPTPAPTAPPTPAPTVATTPASIEGTTPASAANEADREPGARKQAALNALQKSCLNRSGSPGGCACLRAQAATNMNVAQITTFVRSVNAGKGLGPEAKAILRTCGLADDVVSSRSTPPTKRGRKR